MGKQFPDTTFITRGRLSDLVREEVSRHRLSELAGAIHEHEERTKRQGLGRRSYDEALYRRSRLIAGEAEAA
ncbi:MAG TPA: hypothetical protein VGO66_09340 [Solirubrobacterales bacterium]|jgi:hypothetical protein|nr:hypothetical protein [Solirubrobacterales bacterium]